LLRSLYLRNPNIDVYHINWLQNALVLPNNSIPLLTTVLGTDMRLLELPGVSWMMRRVLRRRASIICPNAQWMVPGLQKHFGDVSRIRFIPFGIDPSWFSIVRRPISPRRWLCVARLTDGKIGHLFSWGKRHFANGRRELHLFGPMQQQVQVPEWVHYHGATTPELLCSRLFPEATGLVSLSTHAEGRPQVMLEAMASSLPIIASRIPAHEDLLSNGVTGYLCGDQAEFGNALDELDEPEVNQAMGSRARDWALREFGSWDDCADRYARAYCDMQESPPRRD
jgi:glycosyltransferase involved in cell wall biosynthesis